MPLMISAVDRVIATTYGHALGFKKGEPLNVPTALVAMVMEKGCYPADGEEAAVAAATAEPAPRAVPNDPEVRLAAIIEAINKLAAEGKLTFSAGNKPRKDTVGNAVGWEISAAERDAAWDAIMEARAGD